MGAERPLALKARKDSEGLDALGDATRQSKIDFAQAKHLQGLDQAGVTCSAGRADGVVGARDACINCNLTRWVVGHGAGIVMVRPKLGVVVELRDIIDLVLRFYIPMFGRAYVDADPALVIIFKVESAARDRFASCEDCDAASACADTEFLAGLVFFRIEVTNACGHLADGSFWPHVAHVDHLYTCDPIEKVLTIFFK